MDICFHCQSPGDSILTSRDLLPAIKVQHSSCGGVRLQWTTIRFAHLHHIANASPLAYSDQYAAVSIAAGISCSQELDYGIPRQAFLCHGMQGVAKNLANCAVRRCSYDITVSPLSAGISLHAKQLPVAQSILRCTMMRIGRTSQLPSLATLAVHNLPGRWNAR
jgi:hypothetical protein